MQKMLNKEPEHNYIDIEGAINTVTSFVGNLFRKKDPITKEQTITKS